MSVPFAFLLGFNLTLKFWVMFIIMADVMDVAESRPQGESSSY